MNTFVGGVIVGFSVFSLFYCIMMLSKIHTGILLVHQLVEAQGKALQMAFIKLTKIEKVTDNTMAAAENFVDALRESAEQMMMFRPPNMRRQRGDDTEQFDDLRKSFEDGIRRMEEDDDEEGDEEPEDKWKK